MQAQSACQSRLPFKAQPQDNCLPELIDMLKRYLILIFGVAFARSVLASTCQRASPDPTSPSTFMCALETQIEVIGCDLTITEVYTLPHSTGSGFYRDLPHDISEFSQTSSDARNGLTTPIRIQSIPEHDYPVTC